jgi:hypothetical protein
LFLLKDEQIITIIIIIIRPILLLACYRLSAVGKHVNKGIELNYYYSALLSSKLSVFVFPLRTHGIFLRSAVPIATALQPDVSPLQT